MLSLRRPILAPALMASICFLLAAHAVADGPSDNEEANANRETAILEKSPWERTDDERREAIRTLERELEADPDQTGKRHMKTSLEIALGRYEDALQTTRALVQRTNAPSDRLFLCVLRERLDKESSECYRRVLEALEEKDNALSSFDYLVALRLGDPERFENGLDIEQLKRRSKHPDMLVDHYHALRRTNRGEIIADFTSRKRAGPRLTE